MNCKERIPRYIHSIDFTLAIGCKLNCKYCPQEKLIKNYFKGNVNREKKMSFENFKKCLSQVKKGTDVSFAGLCEPFLNSQCAKMISYAYKEGYKITLFTTLVGLTEENFELIKDIKFESLILHIPDKGNNSKFEITEEYLKILKLVTNNMKISAYSCHGEVHPLVQKYVDSEKRMYSEMMDRAGNLTLSEIVNSVHQEGKINCETSSEAGCSGWTPSILPDGTVILCCMDYGMDHVLGNILKEKWSDIIRNSEYVKIENGFDDDTVATLCRKCTNAKTRMGKNYRYNYVSGDRAIRIGRALEEYKEYLISNKKKEGGLLEKLDSQGMRILDLIISSSEICIYGLGRLFYDNYFTRSWDCVLKANILSDNNPEKWGIEVNGIKCIDPKDIVEHENILVVTFVRNDKCIIDSFTQRNINCISIYDIYNMFD